MNDPAKNVQPTLNLAKMKYHFESSMWTLDRVFWISLPYPLVWHNFNFSFSHSVFIGDCIVSPALYCIAHEQHLLFPFSLLGLFLSTSKTHAPFTHPLQFSKIIKNDQHWKCLWVDHIKQESQENSQNLWDQLELESVLPSLGCATTHWPEVESTKAAEWTKSLLCSAAAQAATAAQLPQGCESQQLETPHPDGCSCSA